MERRRHPIHVADLFPIPHAADSRSRAPNISFNLIVCIFLCRLSKERRIFSALIPSVFNKWLKTRELLCFCVSCAFSPTLIIHLKNQSSNNVNAKKKKHITDEWCGKIKKIKKNKKFQHLSARQTCETTAVGTFVYPNQCFRTYLGAQAPARRSCAIVCEMKGADAFASGDGNSALGGLFRSN